MAKLVIKCDGLPAETIDLKRGINRFGRSSQNDFQVHHESVSRFHCEVEVRDDCMVVRDLDSSNGTYVNDEPIEEATLEVGQVLRLGEVSMHVKEAPKPIDTTSVPCHNHPNFPASMKCTQCGKFFCGSCVHLMKRLNGQFLRLCPVCSGHCLPLVEAAQQRKTIISNFVNTHFMTSIIDKLMGRKRRPPKPFNDGRPGS